MNFLCTIKRQPTRQTEIQGKVKERTLEGMLPGQHILRLWLRPGLAGRGPLLQVAHLQFACRHDGPGRTESAQTDVHVLGKAIPSLPSGIWTAGQERIGLVSDRS